MTARGWRVQPGTEPVPIRTLASPLRYDLVVRRDLMGLCAQHAERGGECDAPLISRARSSPYWLWWTHVYCARHAPELRADRAALERGFAARVRASFELCRSFSRCGFDPARPILLRSAERVLPADSGKTVSARLFASDGCHRTALLWLRGQKVLEPGQYVIRTQREFAPLDNTFLLRDALRDDLPAYVRFVASAYAGHAFEDARELVDSVRKHSPERVEELLSVLRTDALVSVV